MTITVEAIYESGQLKFKEPVVLAEGTPVRVTITPMDQYDDPLAGVIGIGDSGRTDGAENHDKYISGDASKSRPADAQRDPLAGLIGMFSSGRTDGAENHDKYLYGKRP